MAQPLKDMFAEDVPSRIAEMVVAVHPPFDTSAFISDALDGFDALELTERARHIAETLAEHLPNDREAAIEILVRSLGPPFETEELDGMASFIYLPHVYFVAEHGLEHFETSMRAQHELTRRFTAEFSIRAFLQHHPAETLRRLAVWAADSDPHVRRLVSEGTRPRLPWAPRLRRFIEDPTPVIDLLDRLCRDRSLYVRRSVANNLNDISKDHPDVAVATARRWSELEPAVDPYVLRHGLRTLVKRGDADALQVLGYSFGSPAHTEASCAPTRVAVGGRTLVEVVVRNPTERPIDVLLDIRVHFVKRDGSASPKVFKGGSLLLDSGETATLRKSVSLAVHTTRTPHPGDHRVDLIVNGETRPGPEFVVVDV